MITDKQRMVDFHSFRPALRYALASEAADLLQCFEDCSSLPQLVLFEEVCSLLKTAHESTSVFRFLLEKRSQYYTRVYEKLQKSTRDACYIIDLGYLSHFWDCVVQSYGEVNVYGRKVSLADDYQRAKSNAHLRFTAMQMTISMLEATLRAEMCCFFMKNNTINAKDFRQRRCILGDLQCAVATFQLRCNCDDEANAVGAIFAKCRRRAKSAAALCATPPPASVRTLCTGDSA